jgi:hypothetical protein
MIRGKTPKRDWRYEYEKDAKHENSRIFENEKSDESQPAVEIIVCF